MEHLRQDKIEDLSLSPPAVGSMQIAGSNRRGRVTSEIWESGEQDSSGREANGNCLLQITIK
ncbi:hypothetical protein R3W88_000637 [Solanum pinnatisectum]|uniref:Uncharacterized protein n=1 Tax=Solanum pinnatisectum TaxID=50273 RepID=A0AAV9MJ84_9SOLN|nr:hypothetical protein R3W88_000637 [Solanum pinnatisectum]